MALGRDAVDRNQAEFNFSYISSGSNDNALLLGLRGASNFDCIKIKGTNEVEFKGAIVGNDVFTISTAQASSGVANNSFFRDSGRSNKLSYKGVAGAITEIEA